MFLISALIICGIGAFFGYRRGLVKTAVRVAELFVAALLTLLIVGVLLKPQLLSLAESAFNSLEADPNGLDALFEIPSLAFFMYAVIASFTALIIYFPIYFIINKLLLIPHYFISKLIDQKQLFADKLTAPVSKWTGLAVGVLGALITYSLYTMPLCGILVMGHSMAEDINNAYIENAGFENEAVFGTLKTYISQQETLTEKLIYKPFVSSTFSAVTTYTCEETSGKIVFNLSDELTSAVKLLASVPYYEDEGDTEDRLTIEDIKSLNSIADAVEQLEKEERLTARLISDIITEGAAELYGSGSFLDIELKHETANNPVVKKLLKILMDTSSPASARIRNVIGIAENIFNISNTLEYVISDEFDVNNTAPVKQMLHSVKKIDINITTGVIDLVMSSSDVFEDAAFKKLRTPINEVFTMVAESEYTEQDFEIEAFAINNVLDCGLNADVIDGEEAAERIIGSIMDSKALSAAINKLHENNSVGTISVSEDSAEYLTVILNKYENENVGDKQTIDAIRDFFGLN